MKLTLLFLLAAVTWVGKVSSCSYPHPHGLRTCPPPNTPGFSCGVNTCTSQRDCPLDKPFCCDTGCRKKTCTAAYQTELSPLLCPAANLDIRCLIFLNQCVNDKQCGSGKVCCSTNCGRECRNKVVCPDPNSFNRQCFQFLHQCDSNEECGFGKICCLVSGCGRECMEI